MQKNLNLLLRRAWPLLIYKTKKKLGVDIQWNVLLSDNAKKTKHQGFPGKSCRVKLTEV